MSERTGPCDPKSTLPEREEGGARVCQTCGGSKRAYLFIDENGMEVTGKCPACKGTGEVRDERD